MSAYIYGIRTLISSGWNKFKKIMKKHKKTAVVIGATGNLGRAVCKILSKNGYEIDPIWLGADHPDATRAESYGSLPKKIDLAVYLAGINLIKNTEAVSEKEWDEVLGVNLKGAFLFAKAAFPGMKAAGRSTFVVISSIMATHPYPKRALYAASKAGLEGLTRELAVEWGRYGISANAIRLGHLRGLMKTTKTSPQLLDSVRDKIPSGRLIHPEDVASFILWLSEGGSAAVSGGVIDFDPAYAINRWPLSDEKA